MIRLAPLLLAAAACAAPGSRDYVPGGHDLKKAVRAKYRDAVDLENKGKPEEALNVYDKLSARYGTRLAFHLPRIRLTRQLKGRLAAAALYDPPPMGVGADRAEIFVGLATLAPDDFAGRRSLMEFAVVKEPEEAYWRLAVAELELQSHDVVVERAGREHALGDVTPAEESFREARLILERAEEDAERALRLDPMLAAAQHMLGYIATRQADIADYNLRDEWRKKAGAHYERALRLDPEFVEARINQAENYLYFSQADKAIRDLRICTDMVPGQVLVWRNLGLALFRDGKVKHAAKAYRRALEIEPKSARTRVALADCLRELKDSEEAIAELSQALEEAVDDGTLQADIAFKLAAIYEFAGEYAKAVEQYERHVELEGKEAGKAKYRIRLIYDGAFD